MRYFGAATLVYFVAASFKGESQVIHITKLKLYKDVRFLFLIFIILVSLSAVSYGEGKVKNMNISAESAVVYCENTGTVVFEKNGNLRIDPGEATKIMTALVAVQKLPLDRDVKISRNAANQHNDRLGLKEGEFVSVEDLLYGVLMLGSNSAATALGESAYGNIDKFTDKMNETAKNIGCRGVRFTNVTGVAARYQQVTAKEYLKILRVAFSNRTISKIGMEKGHRFSDTNKQKSRFLKKEEIIKSDNLFFSGWTGVETSAKTQVAANVFNNGMQLHVILLNENGSRLKSDMKSLLDYAKSKLDGYKVVYKGREAGKARVKHGEKTRVTAYAATDGYAYLPKEGSKSLIKTETAMKADLQAPIKSGDIVGYCYIYVGDEVVNKVPLICKENVGVGWFPSYIGISNFTTVIILIITGFLVLIFIWIASVRASALRKRKRLRKKQIQRMARQQVREEEERRRRGWKY